MLFRIAFSCLLALLSLNAYGDELTTSSLYRENFIGSGHLGIVNENDELVDFDARLVIPKLGEGEILFTFDDQHWVTSSIEVHRYKNISNVMIRFGSESMFFDHSDLVLVGKFFKANNNSVYHGLVFAQTNWDKLPIEKSLDVRCPCSKWDHSSAKVVGHFSLSFHEHWGHPDPIPAEDPIFPVDPVDPVDPDVDPQEPTVGENADNDGVVVEG